MRHFLIRRPLASAVGRLALGVEQASAASALVTLIGFSLILSSSSTTALIRAVSLPTVAPRTDVYHLSTLVTHKAATIGANVLTVHGLVAWTSSPSRRDTEISQGRNPQAR